MSEDLTRNKNACQDQNSVYQESPLSDKVPFLEAQPLKFNATVLREERQNLSRIAPWGSSRDAMPILYPLD